jgi:GTPase SAR1 family protein
MIEPWSTATLAARIGVAAYQQRKPAMELWRRIYSKITGRNENIVITGMPGVGKSVLLDHMTGVAYERGYTPPGTSKKAEKSRLYKPGSVTALTVVPGQDKPNRYIALDEVLGKKVNGIIHVVSNGFTTLRKEEAGLLLREQNYDTLDKFRQLQLEAEVRDFENTVQEVRKSARSKGAPVWLLVAVGKVDLYYEDDQLLDAYAHYAKAGGAFFDRVHEFAGHMGRDNLDVDVIPFCAWPENFTWGSEKVTSSLHTRERDGFVVNLLSALDSLSEHS